jgi:protein CWC15
MQRDFRAELEEKEAKHFKKRLGGAGGIDAVGQLTAGDGDADAGPRFVPKALDADDSDSDDASGSDSDSDSDDDEDDTQALLAELERIKKDRAEETARQAAEAREAEDMERAEELATGNPLLNIGADSEVDFTVKRRWDDDVVFRNQTRGEQQKKKRFINDTIRSDFHKRFLNKYIK